MSTQRLEVEEQLNNYMKIKQRLSVLQYELKRFSGLEYDDVIEAMVFAKSMKERVQESGVSDKTATVALNYKRITECQNAMMIHSLFNEHETITELIAWIDHCMENLTEPVREIAYDLYIKKISWDEICQKQAISRSTLGRLRKRALDELQGMFDQRNSLNIRRFFAGVNVV